MASEIIEGRVAPSEPKRSSRGYSLFDPLVITDKTGNPHEYRKVAAAGAVADGSRVPNALRALPGWATKLRAAGPLQAPDRVFAFGLGADLTGRTVWTINGRPYDMERIDATPELGSVETWLLVNTYTTSHVVHLHDVDWVVVGRNGAAPEAQELGLKETFRLDPGEAVLVGAKFTDHLGPYMIHCHMLNHEDDAMMTTFEVVAPGQGAATAVEPAEQRRVDRIVADQAARPGRPGGLADRPLPIGIAPVKSTLCNLKAQS